MEGDAQNVGWKYLRKESSAIRVKKKTSEKLEDFFFYPS